MPALAVIGYLTYVAAGLLQRAAIIAELANPAGLNRRMPFSSGGSHDTADHAVGVAPGPMSYPVAV
jgi:hypothetical protein